jgi:ribosomal protein S18 acetylase RimI-like enzyme
MLYAYYLKEREEFETLEKTNGFAVYKLMGDTVYIRDIYVVPKERKSNLATEMANEIARAAKARGVKKMMGTVCPRDKNATENLKVLLAYGMKLFSSDENLICFMKEL